MLLLCWRNLCGAAERLLWVRGSGREMWVITICKCRNQRISIIFLLTLQPQNDAAASPLWPKAGSGVWQGRASVLKSAAAGDMVKLVSKHRFMHKSIISSFVLTSILQKPQPLLAHGCKREAVYRSLRHRQYWGQPPRCRHRNVSICGQSACWWLRRAGVETSRSRGDVGTPDDGGGS